MGNRTVDRRQKQQEGFPIDLELSEILEERDDKDFMHGLSQWFQKWYLRKHIAQRIDTIAAALQK